jgi:hypothetical protein
MGEITIKITAERDGEVLETKYIEKCPQEEWDKFFDNAKKILPERGKEAWAAYLIGQIRNVAQKGHRMFVMTDIPEEAINGISQVLQDMKINFSGLMARMFASSMSDRLKIINFAKLKDVEIEQPNGKIKIEQRADKVDPRDMHFIVITGLDDSMWSPLDTASKKLPSVYKVVNGEPKTNMEDGMEFIATIIEYSDKIEFINLDEYVKKTDGNKRRRNKGSTA